MLITTKPIEENIWHLWFAWYPIAIYNGNHSWSYVWLKTIWRKSSFNEGWENYYSIKKPIDA